MADDSSSLTWIIALAVITVVVSCCVLYAIRRVFSLSEKVNKSQSAVSQLEDMQTQIKILQEAQQQVHKRSTEKEADEERKRKEKESTEARESSSHENVVSRLENLEKGLLEHEAKVEDAVNRVFIGDGRAGGRGGKLANLSAKARKLMLINKLGGKPNASSTGGGGTGVDDDAAADDDDDDYLDGKSLLDMSVLEFATVMSATGLGDNSNNNFSSSGANNLGGGGVNFAALLQQERNRNASTTASRFSYTPSPMFRQLLEHGSFASSPTRKNFSPSNGLFSSSSSSPSNLATSALSNDPNVAKQQRLAIMNNYLSKTNVIGGNGVIQPPPSFWIYEKSFSAGGSLRSLKRRLHSISFVSSSSSSSLLRTKPSNGHPLNDDDDDDDDGNFQLSADSYGNSRSRGGGGRKRREQRQKASLVLKFAVAEAVSSQQQNTLAGESGQRSFDSSIRDRTSGREIFLGDSEMSAIPNSVSIDMGLPADGAGPGILAIPLLSITMIEITVVSPFYSSENRSNSLLLQHHQQQNNNSLNNVTDNSNNNNHHNNNSNTSSREILEAFSYICGVGVPILVFRVEHRGPLGDWSPSRQSMRDDVATNPQQQITGTSSSSSSSSSSGWTRQRALEKAATIPSCSARGAAATAFTFYMPFSKTTAPTVLHYVEYLRKMLDHAVAIDDDARRVLIDAAATDLMSRSNQQQSHTITANSNATSHGKNRNSPPKRNDDFLANASHLL